MLYIQNPNVNLGLLQTLKLGFYNKEAYIDGIMKDILQKANNFGIGFITGSATWFIIDLLIKLSHGGFI